MSDAVVGSQPNTLPSATTPCTSCGLCCDGTMFRQANDTADQRDYIASLGFQAKVVGESVRFNFPCARLDGCCCTIYDRRPQICSTFDCKLLSRFKRGEISQEAAGAKVAAAKSLIADIAQVEPAYTSAGGRKRYLRALRTAPQSLPEAVRTPQFRLRIMALSKLLQEHFYK